MHKLVLIRHGESTWNLENRFTGWTDVDLSERGVTEAHHAATLLREGGFTFDIAFSSVLKYYGSELNKRRNELLMSAGGSDALEWESARSREGASARDWLRSNGASFGRKLLTLGQITVPRPCV